MIVGNDPILLTPGPLTTSLATKQAMLRDWGSWDAAFNSITASLRRDLVDIVGGGDEYTCVPLQGSGTFSVEAAIGTLVPRGGKVLVPNNGAYCARIVKICSYLGREAVDLPVPEDQPATAAVVDAALAADPSITHVAQVHCETGAGVLNDLEGIAQACAKRGKGLIVDAMSSFAALPIDVSRVPFDALVAASGKCLEGVPGMGFVIVRRNVLEACSGNAHSLAMDLHDQYLYMEKTTQWRYTPPTHVVAALRAAVDQFKTEGGQAARLARYRRQLRDAGVRHGNARVPPLPATGSAGADHCHLPCAGGPGVRLQDVLRRGSCARLHPLPRQADAGRNVSSGVHRSDRRQRDAQRCHRGRQDADRPRNQGGLTYGFEQGSLICLHCTIGSALLVP